jgi:hypothetical protein
VTITATGYKPTAVSITIGGPLTLTPMVVVFGHKSTLTGTLVSKQSGQSVQIQGTECGT